MKKAAIGCTTVLVIVLLVVAGFSFLGSKEWRIERAASVRTTPEAVHARIADLRLWREWSTWIQDANPSGAFVYTGEPGVGMTAAWTSERGNACTLAITRSDPATGIDYDLVIADFPSTAHGTFALAPADGGTHVVWTTWGERTDLLGGFFARLMDPLLGRKFGVDLDRLRIQLEPPG